MGAIRSTTSTGVEVQDFGDAAATGATVAAEVERDYCVLPREAFEDAEDERLADVIGESVTGDDCGHVTFMFPTQHQSRQSHIVTRTLVQTCDACVTTRTFARHTGYSPRKPRSVSREAGPL